MEPKGCCVLFLQELWIPNISKGMHILLLHVQRKSLLGPEWDTTVIPTGPWEIATPLASLAPGCGDLHEA